MYWRPQKGVGLALWGRLTVLKMEITAAHGRAVLSHQLHAVEVLQQPTFSSISVTGDEAMRTKVLPLFTYFLLKHLYGTSKGVRMGCVV